MGAGIEPSGLNPRAQTLGIELRDRTAARAGFCHGTRRGVGSRESYCSRYVSYCLIVLKHHGREGFETFQCDGPFTFYLFMGA